LLVHRTREAKQDVLVAGDAAMALAYDATCPVATGQGVSNDEWIVQVEHWRVFPRGTAGGNPCPLVVGARELTAGQMRAIAAHHGHESAFVTSLSASCVGLRYFVPRHEMRMCVHATIAAVTALIGSGVLAAGQAAVSTASGDHQVSWDGGDPPEVTVGLPSPDRQSAPARTISA
jgi:PhzF family phenazine biosynthesis protein